MTHLRLLLVRHGESEANANRRMQGRLDSPLTPRGQRQAEAIGARIAADVPIEKLYSSPLQRALQTALAIGRHTHTEPVLLDDLMETDIGYATGLTWREFEERWPQNARDIRADTPAGRWPAGESRAQLAERAAGVIASIMSRHTAGTVVVVSHGGTLRYAVAHLMAGTELVRADHRFDNCAITEVVLGDGPPRIACANDSSHLAEVEEEEAHSA